jgi:hypothetical protein
MQIESLNFMIVPVKLESADELVVKNDEDSKTTNNGIGYSRIVRI